MNKYMNLTRLEYLVTYKCSSKCKHCFNANIKEYDNHIEKDMALHVLDRIGREYKLNSVMTFGGEPLLFLDIVCAIHSKARDLGVKSREVITNAYWTRDPDQIKRTARELIDSGVNRILLSVDAFHQEYIDISIVKEVARLLLSYGIEDIKWNPCWVISKEDRNEYNLRTDEILSELDCLGIRQSSGNILSPRGGAISNLSKYLPSKNKLFDGKCSDIPYTDDLNTISSICINPDGNVPICPSFVLGNIKTDDILQIIRNYDPYSNRKMRIILEKGMRGLLDEYISEKRELNGDGYYSMCDMCKDISIG